MAHWAWVIRVGVGPFGQGQLFFLTHKDLLTHSYLNVMGNNNKMNFLSLWLTLKWSFVHTHTHKNAEIIAQCGVTMDTDTIMSYFYPALSLRGVVLSQQPNSYVKITQKTDLINLSGAKENYCMFNMQAWVYSHPNLSNKKQIICKVP